MPIRLYDKFDYRFGHDPNAPRTGGDQVSQSQAEAEELENEPAQKQVKKERVPRADEIVYASYKKMIAVLMTPEFDPAEVDPATGRNREDDRKLGIAAFGQHLFRILVEKVENGDEKIVTEYSAKQLRARLNEIFPPEPTKTGKERLKGTFEKFKAKLG